MIKIYSKTSVELYSTEKYKYNGSFMGDRMITLNVESPTPISFVPGCYVDFRSERFVLDLVPAAKKISSASSAGNALSYDLIFYPYQHELKKCDFLDVVLGGNTLHYTGLSKVEFIGTVQQLADRIHANLDRLYTGGSAWTVTVVDAPTTTKSISLTDVKCWDALLQMQSLFGLNFTVKNRVITINPDLTEYDHVFTYGQGNGLYSIERLTKSDDPVITRLRCYGSSENIPANYKKGVGSIVPTAQYIPALMLPDYETTLIDYIDSSPENIAIYGIREGIFRDEDIRPTIKGITGDDINAVAGHHTITSGAVDVLLNYTAIEANSTQNTFQVEIPDLDFMISDYLVAGVTAMLELTDGVLGGKAFPIVDSLASDDGFVLTLNRNKDDTAATFPNSDVYPSAGDHFVLTGIYMPDLYVKVAENRLESLGTAFLADNDHSKFSYSLGTDEIFMIGNDMKDTITEGEKIPISDSSIGVNSFIIIQQLNITFDELIPKYEITLSDKPLLSALDLVRKGIAESTQKATTTATQAEITNRLTDLKQDELVNTLYDPVTGVLNPYIPETTITTIFDTKDLVTGLISGSITWREALIFDATDIYYKILGIYYTSSKKTITLDAADSADRIDTFYTNTDGNLSVQKGTPSATPAKSALVETQLEIMTVLIPANSLTPDGFDTEWIYRENTSPDWSKTSTVDTYASISFGSTVDPLNGTKRIKLVISAPDTFQAVPVHKIGEKYQGGIVFWIDPEDNRKGLIVAAHDTHNPIFWSRLSGYSSFSTDGRDSAIGTGQANTTKMLTVAACNWLAVKYCNELVVDGYNDWFMPSFNELEEIFKRRIEIDTAAQDAFASSILYNKRYWSSTESTWEKAYFVTNDLVGRAKKNENYYVRAIRKFDDSELPTNIPVVNVNLRTTGIEFTAPAAIDTSLGVLSFNLKSSVAWADDSKIIITSKYGAKETGISGLSKENMSGYKSGDDSWQLVSIPIFRFYGQNEDQFTGFKFDFRGEWTNGIDLGIDDIRYQFTQIADSLEKEKTYRTDYRFKESLDGERVLFTTLLPYISKSVEFRINNIPQIKGTHFWEEDNSKIRLYKPLKITSFVSILYYTYKI